MFTVADLFQLSILESADILTGKSGFDRPICNAGVLDYEYISGEIYEGFLPDDLVLSSFLSLREHPHLMADAIRALVDIGVSCAGIKKIYLESLPDELIQYAVEKNFSIFLFEKGISFSDIIIAVFDNLKYEDRGNLEEKIIDKLMERSVSPEEARKLALDINADFYENAAVVYLRGKHRFLGEEIKRIQRGLVAVEKEYEIKWSVSRYQSGAVAFITFCNSNEEEKRQVIRKLCDWCVLQLQEVAIGISSFLEPLSRLGIGLIEAIYACKFGRMNGTQTVSFQELGAYRLMLPLADSMWGERYCDAVLGRLVHGPRCDKKKNGVLLETLKVYIRSGRNLKKAADELNQHENTVRYRVHRICDLLGLKMNEEADWMEVCMAMLLHEIMTAGEVP